LPPLPSLLAWSFGVSLLGWLVAWLVGWLLGWLLGWLVGWLPIFCFFSA